MTAMWFPKSAQEVSDAIANGILRREATSLDYKKEPPVPAKNVEMAPGRLRVNPGA